MGLHRAQALRRATAHPNRTDTALRSADRSAARGHADPSAEAGSSRSAPGSRYVDDLVRGFVDYVGRSVAEAEREEWTLGVLAGDGRLAVDVDDAGGVVAAVGSYRMEELKGAERRRGMRRMREETASVRRAEGTTSAAGRAAAAVSLAGARMTMSCADSGVRLAAARPFDAHGRPVGRALAAFPLPRPNGA